MVEKELCTGCGACAAICPQGAVTMEPDWEGFLYPSVDNRLCTNCSLCEKVCPISTPECFSGENTYYGAKAKDDKTRLLGSSGGIFPLLAESVISDGGVVFAAALGKDAAVRHVGISRTQDIPLVTRTKYVQSDLSQVYAEIKPLLRQGRKVLFCGTPCQTDAVRSYTGPEQDNLILADLICYGVPSPGIWADYVRFLEKKYKGAFGAFFFRDKRNADSGHTAALVIDGKEYTYPLYQDSFCRSFFRNVNIRPSCFSCRYCTTERNSDITLGDFWGIEHISPDFDDKMGSSAIICHTDKGKQIWEKIQEKTEYFVCRMEDVANSDQPRLREPTVQSPRRGLYMWLYRRLPFSLWLRLFR